MNTRLSSGRWIVAGALALALSISARGQNPYVPGGAFPPGGYYGGGYYPGPAGGALQGAASVINAQGQLQIQTQQAYQEQQKYEQMKLETKQKAFNEMMYEKANTATLPETLQYESQMMNVRLMQSPTPAEVTLGRTLNAMLPMIKQLGVRGTQGPPISLDQEMLKHINVTVGKDGSNVGPLRNGGADLEWPFCLRSPTQKRLAKEIPQAVEQAKTDSLEPKLYRSITMELSDLNEELRTKFHKDEIDSGEFLEGRRFLDSLTPAVKALTKPGTTRFLDGSYAAKGRTVPELVEYMVKNGLSFTACNPGDENAYYALHDLFVAYTTSAQAAAGFQVRYNPPRTDPWKVK